MAVTTKKGQTITASRTDMRAKPPVLANAADTSRDAEKQILQPPQPFANAQGIAKLPTGRVDGATWGIPYGEGKPVNAKPQNIGKHVGAANTSLSAEEMAAIGYAPTATESSSPIISGFPAGRRRTRSGQR